MKTLVRKMSSLKLLKVELILGTVFSAIATVGLPISIFCLAPELLTEPLAWAIALIGMLFFGSVGYFLFVRPYRIYNKLPDVLAEHDGEFLYIHGKKEAKIPLADLDGTGYFIHFPFLYSNELVATLVTHLLSEKYGDLDLDVPGYGSYKLRFVSNVHATANALMAFINQAINSN